MALVAAYGSSDESDYSEEEEDDIKVIIGKDREPEKPTATVKAVEKPKIVEKKHTTSEKKLTDKLPLPKISISDKPSAPVKPSVINKDDLDISDEDEDDVGGGAGGILDDPEPDLFSLISAKLPQVATKKKIEDLVDTTEDCSSIPTKKDYGDVPEEPPAKKKKKRDGPVRITIPSLDNDLDEEEEAARKKVNPSTKGSGLFSLLPQPKNKPKPEGGRLLVPNSVATKKPNISTEGPSNFVKNNLKPSGVRSVGLVPHRVANPVKKGSDSDDDDDDFLGVGVTSGSYFPEPRASRHYDSASHRGSHYDSASHRGGRAPSGPLSHAPSSAPLSHALPRVNTAPDTGSAPLNFRPGFSKPKAPRPPPSQVDLSSDFLSLSSTTADETGVGDDLGPATAPYPPPMPGPSSSNANSVDSEEAIRRLAGKQNRMKEADIDIREVHEDDMKGDPRVWLTKAMTEEQAPRPSGKGPRGLARSRHQITYLAHMAQEREWELKQEWSQAAHNRRASANKYGFI